MKIVLPFLMLFIISCTLEAARKTHEILYEVVSGKAEPYDREPLYLGL